ALLACPERVPVARSSGRWLRRPGRVAGPAVPFSAGRRHGRGPHARRKRLTPALLRCYTEGGACEFCHLPPTGSKRGGFHGTSSDTGREGSDRRPAGLVVRHSGVGAGRVDLPGRREREEEP